MRLNRHRQTERHLRRSAAFTLAEVLAALLMMAIIIPVALQGMGVISRASELGQRKVAAMRIAERVLDEQIVLVAQGQQIPASSSGQESVGDVSYPWTMQTEPWPQDAMTQMTVQVDFTVRGAKYQMSASTLFDPAASTPGTGASPGGT